MLTIDWVNLFFLSHSKLIDPRRVPFVKWLSRNLSTSGTNWDKGSVGHTNKHLSLCSAAKGEILFLSRPLRKWWFFWTFVMLPSGWLSHYYFLVISRLYTQVINYHALLVWTGEQSYHPLPDIHIKAIYYRLPAYFKFDYLYHTLTNMYLLRVVLHIYHSLVKIYLWRLVSLIRYIFVVLFLPHMLRTFIGL